MHRLLVGIGVLTFAANIGLYWPTTEPIAATETATPGTSQQSLCGYVASGRLTVHRPVPHPAVLAAGQLLISLYVLVAQQSPQGRLPGTTGASNC